MISMRLPVFLMSKVALRFAKSSATHMTMSIESIRQKFETYVYSLQYVPSVVVMDSSGVRVNESAPYIDIVDALENRKSAADMLENILMPELKATSYGDWTFQALVLPTNYFENRDKFEEMLIDTNSRHEGPDCIKSVKIPIREAIKAMRVDISSNMDYCLQNKNELDADLMCEIPEDLDLSNDLLVRKLENMIFYKLMCKIFGKESANDQVEVDGNEILYEKSFMISDFDILSFDGNSMVATATRDDYYIVFYFDY